MIVVGLTGNLASGKSEAAKLMKDKGAVVVDADMVARKLTEKGKPLFKAIVKFFGKQFVDKKGVLDRRKLALHVFSHPKDLKKLNVIVHPGVILELYKEIDKHRSKKGFLILDAPLLFESKMEKLADYSVVIKASESNMLSRASRRGIPSALARKILAAQWPVMKTARLADFVIDNDGTILDLKHRVKSILNEILKKQQERESEYVLSASKNI